MIEMGTGKIGFSWEVGMLTSCEEREVDEDWSAEEGGWCRSMGNSRERGYVKGSRFFNQ